MPFENGNDMLLKIEDPQSPGTYLTVGGLKNTDMQFSSTAIDVTNKLSNEWREILDNAGKRSVNLSGTGIFKGTAAEQTLRDNALGNTITNFEITFGNGSILSGAFKISNYNRSGANSQEETYSVSLISSGEMDFS